MPKIRRQNLSPALLQHLLDRIQQREISANQLGLLAIWLDQNPGVPAGQWFNPETAVETRRSRRARRRKPSCGRGSFVTHQVSVARVKLSLFLLRDLRALRVSIAVFRFIGHSQGVALGFQLFAPSGLPVTCSYPLKTAGNPLSTPAQCLCCSRCCRSKSLP